MKTFSWKLSLTTRISPKLFALNFSNLFTFIILFDLTLLKEEKNKFEKALIISDQPLQFTQKGKKLVNARYDYIY